MDHSPCKKCQKLVFEIEKKHKKRMLVLILKFDMKLQFAFKIYSNKKKKYRKPLRIGAAVNTRPYNYRNAANPSHFIFETTACEKN
ncbi:hypothetical protein BpHYR1_038431 [Brachionus plicatilis]|uniref:Uncharacterized protein n=1 Tax=Brachionus plicatilis TaxID=10195 RepID=A0A3M7Q0C8_BRAPC|nr:hypothetical protein BpHYR1_038431 [Brachionus plicatilis]